MPIAATARAAMPNYVISKADSVSDMLEVAVLLKEVGLLRPREGRLDVNIVPLFETIDDLRTAAASWTSCSPCRRTAACSPRAATCRR